MSQKHLLICDICGKEIKNTEGYYTVTRYPALIGYDGESTKYWRNDVCNNCISKCCTSEVYDNKKESEA